MSGCGTEHSFIFYKKENKLFLFGDNLCNQIGLDNNNISKLNSISNNIIENFNLNFSKIKKFEIGGLHNLILFENNNLFSFGRNDFGQCGINNEKKENQNILIPKKIKFFKNKKIINIFCGSICSLVLLENNELFSFGFNDNGELGIENNDQNINKKINKYYEIYYFIPQKIKIKLTQPGNEKIIKIFTSSISNHSFLLTKLININYKNESKIKKNLK